MKDHDAWLSIQPLLTDEDALTFDEPTAAAKWIEVTDGTDRMDGVGKGIGV